MNLGSTPSDAAGAVYSLYSLGYKNIRDRRKKKKARKRREAYERAMLDRRMGEWNKSHSPLSSKRSFFVPNVYSARNVLRSYVNYGRR